MNKKAIKAVLNKKFKDWLKSIEDKEVRKLVKENTIITGGSIASMLLKEKIKDFDVYFRNKETVLAVANYYAKKFNEGNKDKINRLGHKHQVFVLDGRDVAAWKDGLLDIEDFAPSYANQGEAISHMITNTEPERVKMIFRSDGIATAENETLLENDVEDIYDTIDEIPEDELEKIDEGKEKYRPIFISTNAITLSNKIQIVVRFYGEPEEIHDNYDFVHCTNYWTSWDDVVVLKQEALESLLSKQLKYVGSKYPLCSVIRTRKFLKRGFHINAGQYLKMLFQVSQLDLTDINMLEDQLVGVDSAYFMSLIQGLRSKQKSDSDFVLDSDYVASIVDRIF